MAGISTYLGLFTGLIIAGMGGYLYLHPIGAGYPAWVGRGLPAFMIAYGAIRLAFSLYSLLRRRGRVGASPVVFLPLLFLNSCSSDEPQANMRMKFDYVGDCSSCPISRMDSILRVFFPKGIVGVSLDTANHVVSIDLDSHHVRMDTLKTVLLAYGYEIDEDISIDPVVSACCASVREAYQGGGGSTSGGSGPSASELPSPEIHEEMTQLERELEQELGVSPETPQLNLDSELNLDEDLGLDELDLEGGGGIGIEDLSLDDMDMEADLDLDMEESKPKKPPQKKP
ncbi:MAG: hypothetical protein NZZ60_02185 [Bacteroidia bacterium]|nr:hypothetical protein [Bacteroidia bacterium]MDW8417368.1 hypothetical protein [Bacteroidia bacterium]